MKWTIAICVLLISGMCVPCMAQEEGRVGIEGYVFNKRTGRPLSRVLIEYNSFDRHGGGPLVGVFSDANGFYQFDSILKPETTPGRANYLAAYCQVGGKMYMATIQLYQTLRDDRYTRNLYIDVPSQRSLIECEDAFGVFP